MIKTLERLPEDVPIWMLPTQSIGFSPEHASFPGTLSLSASVLLQLIRELGEQIALMGFKRLILFNAHGGQIGLLQAVSRELRVKCPSMAVLPCFLWSGVSALDHLIPEEEREGGLHAGLAETSLMISMSSELVGPERPIDGDNLYLDSDNKPPEGWSLEGAAPWSWLTKDLSISGVIGDSRGSNKVLGEELEQVLIAHWLHLFSTLLNSKWPPVEVSNY